MASSFDGKQCWPELHKYMQWRTLAAIPLLDCQHAHLGYSKKQNSMIQARIDVHNGKGDFT